MWPFKKKRKFDELRVLFDGLKKMIDSQAEEFDRALDHLTWRVESFMRLHEEVHGIIAPAEWGPPPLVSTGSPLDLMDVPPLPEAPDAAEGE